MKAKIKHYLKEIILFTLLLIVATNLLSYYKSQSLNKSDQTYFPQNNKPLVLHFWATWCPVCKAEASNINLLSKHYQVITVAVKSGTNKEIQNYLKEHHYSYKVVNDSSGEIAKKFHIAAFPTTFIYDKNHKLSSSEVGYTSTIGLFLRAWWAGF